MTISVRKTSFTIGVGVCQGTLMSTKRTFMSLECGDSSSLGTMVALHLTLRRDRVSLLCSWKTARYSQEKNYEQDPEKHIEDMNQYHVADL